MLDTLRNAETAATLHGERGLVHGDLKGTTDDVAHDAHVSTVANKLLGALREAEESAGERGSRISDSLSFSASFIMKLVQLDSSAGSKESCKSEQEQSSTS